MSSSPLQRTHSPARRMLGFIGWSVLPDQPATHRLSLPRLQQNEHLLAIAIGATSTLIPAVLIALLAADVPVTTPGVVLVACVALSTYLAGWVGGATALLLTALLLDLLFLSSHPRFVLPDTTADLTGLSITLVAGAGLIWLIQRVKDESLADRQAAVAARAATAAVTSLESAAAIHAGGRASDRAALNDAILRTFITMNRAHLGALFLRDTAGDFRKVADYGIDAVADRLATPADIAPDLARRVTEELQPRAIRDLTNDGAGTQSALSAAGVRSLLMIPIVGERERLLGIAVIGLLVSHRFTSTEFARVQALALRAAAIIDAASGIDRRESALVDAQESLDLLSSVIEAMPEAVVIALPPDGRIGAENAAAIALLGPQSGNHLTTTLLMPDGTLPDPLVHPVSRAFATGETGENVEMLASPPGRDRVPVLVSAAPIIDGDGHIVAVVAVYRDISALKEASRLKDEFVSIVSHELRSPLTPIRGYVQLVARDLARAGTNPDEVKRLQSITPHIDRMARLVDDLLDVSRMRSGGLDIRRRPADLADITAAVVRDRTSTIVTGHRIDLESPESLTGQVDGERLYQVIDNLVGNAIKYSPAESTVSVRLDVDGDWAELTVADEGPGIRQEDRERIFSAFYRTEEATVSRIGGLGLGLYICAELVHAHGGTIAVDETDTGGAAFRVRLPLMDEVVAGV